MLRLPAATGASGQVGPGPSAAPPPRGFRGPSPAPTPLPLPPLSTASVVFIPTNGSSGKKKGWGQEGVPISGCDQMNSHSASFFLLLPPLIQPYLNPWVYLQANILINILYSFDCQIFMLGLCVIELLQRSRERPTPPPPPLFCHPRITPLLPPPWGGGDGGPLGVGAGDQPPSSRPSIPTRCRRGGARATRPGGRERALEEEEEPPSPPRPLPRGLKDRHPRIDFLPKAGALF